MQNFCLGPLKNLAIAQANIYCKSNFAHANSLGHFAPIPITFASPASPPIAHATLPSHLQSLPKECRCPSPL